MELRFDVTNDESTSKKNTAQLMSKRHFPRLDGLPPYVLGEVDARKAALRAAGENVYDFGLGNPDHGSPPVVVARLLKEAALSANHRYAPSPGVAELKAAICRWYARRYGVTLDPELDVVATLGAKEGLAQLFLGTLGSGDVVLVPDPSYPIHRYGVWFAGAETVAVPMGPGRDVLSELESARLAAPRPPKMAVVNFPHNPTGQTIDRAIMAAIVRWAKQHEIWLVSDFAYADLVFSGEAPSVLEVPWGHECACEFFTLSKSYNMPGWRVGFCVGNRELVGALKRIKGYLDYGHFAPLQLAAATALDDGDHAVAEIRGRYRERRDALIAGLASVGWKVDAPAATMFVWAKIPESQTRGRGSSSSVAFALELLDKARVAVAPGVAFGSGGEGYVRFALVEEVERTTAACVAIGRAI